MIIIMIIYWPLLTIIDHDHDHDHDHSILLIRVDRFNPAKTSKSSNSWPKGFSVARGQGDPWSIEYRERDRGREGDQGRDSKQRQ